MNILILTNTFTPHVGGVARSVAAFTEEYRSRGHRVLVVAPEFPDMPQDEGLFVESLMAAIASGDEAAKSRVRAFLEGRAAKVRKA